MEAVQPLTALALCCADEVNSGTKLENGISLFHMRVGSLRKKTKNEKKMENGGETDGIREAVNRD